MSAARSVELHCPVCDQTWTVGIEEVQPGLLVLPRFGCAGCGSTPYETLLTDKYKFRMTS